MMKEEVGEEEYDDDDDDNDVVSAPSETIADKEDTSAGVTSRPPTLS